MKPTPCEHEWIETGWGNYCRNCDAVDTKPTPEEKCKCFCHTEGFAGDITQHHCCSPSPEARCAYEHLPDRVCMKCGKYEPTPEARVDWDEEARELLNGMEGYVEVLKHKDVVLLAKALSAAFEKGRGK